jgi:hypothetical protein
MPVFSFVRGSCSIPWQPWVTWPDHLMTLRQHHACSLRVLLFFQFQNRHLALVFLNRLTNTSSIDVNLRWHFAWLWTHHHNVLLGLFWPSHWFFYIAQHIGMVNTAIQVTRTRPISKSGILPYPGFPICRVLHHSPLGLPCMPSSPLIRLVLGFKESIPFDPSGNLVPPVFL